MAKKSIYRVIGIISTQNRDNAIEAISPYLLRYKQLVISPQSPEKSNKKVPEYLKLQIDFYNHVTATKCHEAVSHLFLEDNSNF